MACAPSRRRLSEASDGCDDRKKLNNLMLLDRKL